MVNHRISERAQILIDTDAYRSNTDSTFPRRHSGYKLAARTNGLKFHFCLSHGLTDAAFDPEWRIYFPRTLKSSL